MTLEIIGLLVGLSVSSRIDHHPRRRSANADMKRIARLMIGIVGGRLGVALWRWTRSPDEQPVSPDWLIDNDRRVWGSGVDQPATLTPINTRRNEFASFNTHRRRTHE